jgi:DNA-binding LacI/PurR family transcriptional regulator
LNIKSVAKEAGVSVATVSRVLNHPDSVAQDTKEHIISVMESLNYKPTLQI